MDNQERIKEMARDIAKRDCYLYDKCPKEHKHNCISQDANIMLESSKNYITIASWLVNEGYQKLTDGSVVLTKEAHDRYMKILVDIQLGKLRNTNGKVVLTKNEFHSMIKTDKEATEYGQQCWNDGKKQGVEEFADFIKSQMGIERDYMGIKYKQGVFSDLDIDDFVKQFNNRGQENNK